MASTSVIKKVETKVSISTPVVDLTATNAEKALAKFIATKEAIKALEEQKAAAEQELRSLLGDAEVGMIRGVERFKLAHSSNSKIDRKVLQEVFPEAFEKTLVTTPYTFIKTL
jgi:predicted phage-related endonuclease